MAVYISLGDDQLVSEQLQLFGLQKSHHIFDKLLTPHLSGIVEAIDDDFEYLFEPIFLNYREAFKNNTGGRTQRVYNSKYKFSFFEDFRSETEIEGVITDYTKKITEFNEMMRNSSINKKMYRIAFEDENVSTLKSAFQRKGYVNFDIKFGNYADDNENWYS